MQFMRIGMSSDVQDKNTFARVQQQALLEVVSRARALLPILAICQSIVAVARLLLQSESSGREPGNRKPLKVERRGCKRSLEPRERKWVAAVLNELWMVQKTLRRLLLP